MNDQSPLLKAVKAGKTILVASIAKDHPDPAAVIAAKAKLSAVTVKTKNSLKGTETSFGYPGHLALCRNVADGDMAAGILLYRILGLWKLKDTKRLNRLGREWIAMSREEWARSAGLSLNELKDRALPRLKRSCCAFLQVRTMRITPSLPNVIWISLDAEAMLDYMTPWDMYEPILNGLGVFAPVPKYPYKAD